MVGGNSFLLQIYSQSLADIKRHMKPLLAKSPPRDIISGSGAVVYQRCFRRRQDIAVQNVYTFLPPLLCILDVFTDKTDCVYTSLAFKTNVYKHFLHPYAPMYQVFTHRQENYFESNMYTSMAHLLCIRDVLYRQHVSFLYR